MSQLDARDVAAAIRETLLECLSDSDLQKDPVAAAIIEDIDGILAGQASGRIESGQPRLARQLIQLVERGHESSQSFPEEIFAAIGECAEQGLSAERHTLSSPDKRRSHVTGLGK